MTLTILRNALKLNAAAINEMELNVSYLKQEVKAWKRNDEIAYAISAQADVTKAKAKLARAVDLQKRMKVEIAAIFRIARIERKYLTVFGKLPSTTIATTYEQEAMLDALIAEKVELEKQAAAATAA